MKVRSVLIAAALLSAGPATIARADGSHQPGDAAPHDDRYECPVNEHTEPATGVQVFEERYDYETGRKECVAFWLGDKDDPDTQYGSWDPGTQDEDPDYSPGDRGQRWSMNNQGPERGLDESDHHYGNHDPQCSQAAQDQLLLRARESLERYDGPDGVARATEEGYVFYPIAWKVYHAFNTELYDDEDPETGVQRDLEPEFPENIVYAMTDDGLKAMGIMFALGENEELGRSWKDYDDVPFDLPDFTADEAVLEDGTVVPAVIDPLTGQPETCEMLWHSHTGEEGAATSFDPENPEESVPMAHVWGWGYDMWERGVDGTEASAWWAPYRAVPAICSERDACL